MKINTVGTYSFNSRMVAMSNMVSLQRGHGPTVQSMYNLSIPVKDGLYSHFSLAVWTVITFHSSQQDVAICVSAAAKACPLQLNI